MSVDGEVRREWMHRRVEAVGALLEAEVAQDRGRDLLLFLDREVAFEERVVGRLAGVPHELGQRGPQHVEDRLHLGRLHPRLVLVEEGVVRRVARLHVLRPAERDVVHAPERGQEDGEVVLRASLEPGGVRLAGLARPGCGDLGRDPAGLLPLAAGDADQARVVGVVVEAVLEWRDLLEELAGLVGDEALVGDPPEGRRGLGSSRPALRRHHRLAVPAQDAECALEVVDLRQALLELSQWLGHAPEPTDQRLDVELAPPPLRIEPLGSRRWPTC